MSQQVLGQPLEGQGAAHRAEAAAEHVGGG